MLDIHCQAYRSQYNSPFVCVIPTNIYGKHDNFSLEDGHVIPSLIHQCYLAKQSGKPFIVRGTGTPLRQFIFSTDLATILVQLVVHHDTPSRVIISSKEEVTIRRVAECIAESFDYKDQIVFDSSYSDGQFKKTADSTVLETLLEPQWTKLHVGIKHTVAWFIEHYDRIRK